MDWAPTASEANFPHSPNCHHDGDGDDNDDGDDGDDNDGDDGDDNDGDVDDDDDDDDDDGDGDDDGDDDGDADGDDDDHLDHDHHDEWCSPEWAEDLPQNVRQGCIPSPGRTLCRKQTPASSSSSFLSS